MLVLALMMYSVMTIGIKWGLGFFESGSGWLVIKVMSDCEFFRVEDC